jgi:hypothetical protein
MKAKKRKTIMGGLLVLLLALPLLSLDITPSRDPADPNLFQFVRIRYNSYGGFGLFRMGNGPPWMHDYPRAEKNFLKILMEVTEVETTPDSYLILTFDDPRILEYPFLYVSEPGYWNITEAEIKNLREYFNRGGFIVFDDFRGYEEMNNLRSAMAAIFPDRTWRELSLDDAVFHCFYDIESLDFEPPYMLVPELPKFLGWFDSEDRLQAVANYNNDIGDYWEWSDQAINPINSNEAYKFGINYVIYSLTH